MRIIRTATAWMAAYAISSMLVLTVMPMQFAASSEPITLKLSFFSSDRTDIYRCQLKPFVDAVNNDSESPIHIDVVFGGALSRTLTDQARLVLDGRADLANVVPGYARKQFPDISIMELPGLFRNEREANRIFKLLVDDNALQGFGEFYIVATFMTGAETIHSRKPISKLADLAGQKIRANNPVEAAALNKLGVEPLLLPLNTTMDALGKGEIDGVTVPTAMLFDFGFGHFTSHNYLLDVGFVPTTLAMSRAKFLSLPPSAQATIRKYSGEWLSLRAEACIADVKEKTLARLAADSRRTVVQPSEGDLAASHRAFESVVEDWAASSPHSSELLARTRTEIAKQRESK